MRCNEADAGCADSEAFLAPLPGDEHYLYSFIPFVLPFSSMYLPGSRDMIVLVYALKVYQTWSAPGCAASGRCEARELTLVAAISRLCHRINGTNFTVFRVPSLLSAACSTAALQLPPHLARHQSKEFVWLSLQSENLLVIKRYLAWSDDEVFAHLLTPHHMCCCNIKYRTEVRVNHQNKTPLKRYLMINVCYFLICLLLSVSTSGLAAPESRLQLKCVVSMMLGLSGLWLWWYTGMGHPAHCPTLHTAKLVLGASDGAEMRPGCIIVAMPISFYCNQPDVFQWGPQQPAAGQRGIWRLTINLIYLSPQEMLFKPIEGDPPKFSYSNPHLNEAIRLDYLF